MTPTPCKQDVIALVDLLAAIEPLQDWTAQLHPKPEKYDRYVAVLTKDQRDAIVQSLRHLASQPSSYEAGRDGDALLDFLGDETCDLRCISVPTGGDDYDVRWQVIEHHMAEPRERVIGQSYTEEPRDAIRDAMERKADRNTPIPALPADGGEDDPHHHYSPDFDDEDDQREADEIRFGLREEDLP